MLTLLLSGCSVVTTSQKGTITLSALNIPIDATNQWYAEIICIRGKNQLTQCLEVTENYFAVDLQIPVGLWDISMKLLDEQGNICYQDFKKDVRVYPDKPTIIDFQLKPANGTIKILIDLSTYPYADSVMRARVYFNDKYKELMRESPQVPLAGEFELAPGSYDFNVRLYTTSFRLTDLIDEGIWQTIDVLPLENQTLIWQPFMQNLIITAEIFVVPQAPDNITAKYNGEQVILTWSEPPADDILGYALYWQISPFEPFELIDVVERGITQYTHDLSDWDHLPVGAYYTIASYSPAMTGYRSTPIYVPFHKE